MARFGEIVNIQPQNISTGAAQGALSLSNRLQSFKAAVSRPARALAARSGQKAGEIAAREAQQAGIAPDFEEPGLFTRDFDIEYQKALQAGYLAGIDNDMRESVSGIAADSPDNLVQFNQAIEGYQRGFLANIDPAVRAGVTAELDNLITDARIQVQRNHKQRARDDAEAERARAMTAITDSGVRAVRDGNQLRAAESVAAYGEYVQTLVEDGTIVSMDAANRMVSDYEKQLAIENVRTSVRSTLEEPGGVMKVTEALKNFRDAPLKGFTVEEQEDIFQVLVTDLTSTLNLKNRQEDAENEAVEDQQDAASAGLYLGILDGTTESTDVAAALSRREINQPQAEKLINTLQNRGQGVDDYRLVGQINEAIRRGEDVTTAIVDNTGGRLTEATAAQLTQTANEWADRESPLQTNESRRAEDFITRSIRVTGPLGALDTEAERRLANAQREFAEAVLSGEDPFAVADRLVDKDRFTRSPDPLTGTKDNLEGALETLNDRLRSGTIDDDTYNFEYEKITELMRIRDNLKGFEDALRDTQRGQ